MASVYAEELNKCVSLNVQILEKLQKLASKGSNTKCESDDETVRLIMDENQAMRIAVDRCLSSDKVEKNLSGFVMTICVIVLLLLIIAIIAVCSNHLRFRQCC